MPELSMTEPASLNREYSAALSVDAFYASTSDQCLVWVGCAR